MEGEKSPTAQKEEEILAFWDKNGIFKKSLEKKSPKGEFVFYDGPPFATGLPHYGHILPGSIKDVIPRYKTMRGYHVRREWGWDCHGLPVENLVEKELDLKTKKDIETFGVEKFNEAARESVQRFTDDWKKVIPRTGRWIDMEHGYRTMDSSYTESVWWAFKTLYDKGLAYEGFKAMQLCPRCETTLSNFEVSQGYVDIVDLTVTVKFRLKDEPNTFMLAWTTTPWTLPGNMALAVNSDAVYSKIQISNLKSQNEYYIIAKERLKDIVKEEYTVVQELQGKDLVGKEYEPPFDYYKEAPIKNKENAWKIYSAPFVSLTDGTGIVHIAPAFGEDDLRLAEEKNIPVLHHVGKDGTFKKEVIDFVGMPVKPKGDHQKTDIEIIKNLAHRGLLFAKEKITHAYPHCWRCETPLLNYAATSWFVRVTAIKNNIVAQNKKVGWIPDEVRLGRFGKWLGGARDWAISRSRYWGAPIPVWRCGKCEELEVIGSFRELSEKTAHSSNQYFLMRHGEAENNVRNIASADSSAKMPLTQSGRKGILRSAKFLKRECIDLIFSSPLLRAKETAFVVAPEVGIPREKVIFDERLREIGFGVYEGKDADEYRSYFSSRSDKFVKAPSGGESLNDVRLRMASFLHEIDQKYSDKNILIVSHDDSLWMLASAAGGLDNEKALALVKRDSDFLKNAEVKKVRFSPLPHNGSYELDVHRPFIDSVKFTCRCGGKMKRVPEVFDCWFESGAMPFAQFHYPFDSEKGGLFEKIFNPRKKIGFPADFIAEGLDQVRGWFYSLLVLGVGLFGVSPYKSVIASGLVLAEDGRKMSKRLQNYPDPLFIMNQYGADALRLYLLSSPVVRGEDLHFSEKGVHEVQNKIVSRLKNVVSFYELYVGSDLQATNYKLQASTHVLDRWILIRLEETVNQVSLVLEEYALDKALRPITLFVDDLSTWYLRRSRDRFKSDNLEEKRDALATTRRALHTFSRVLAPFAPFVAEEVYQKVRSENDPESVHLDIWPQKSARVPVWPNIMALFHRIFKTNPGFKEIGNMETVRRIVSLALEARMAAGIRVRQPVASLKLKTQNSKLKNDEALLQLIKDEVNAKEVVFGADISNEVEIDTTITPELRKEGLVRDLIRHIQDLRKEKGLEPSQKVTLLVEANESGERFVKESEEEIKKATSLSGVRFEKVSEGGEFILDDMKFRFLISPDLPSVNRGSSIFVNKNRDNF